MLLLAVCCEMNKCLGASQKEKVWHWHWITKTKKDLIWARQTATVSCSWIYRDFYPKYDLKPPASTLFEPAQPGILDHKDKDLLYTPVCKSSVCSNPHCSYNTKLSWENLEFFYLNGLRRVNQISHEKEWDRAGLCLLAAGHTRGEIDEWGLIEMWNSSQP